MIISVKKAVTQCFTLEYPIKFIELFKISQTNEFYIISEISTVMVMRTGEEDHES